MTAVICREVGSCDVEELELARPGRTDVLVRIEASGICHSDVSVLTGDLAGELPVVLGHEGAGVVVEAGVDVTTVRPGDRVVLSAIPTCGRCYFCARAQPYLCARAREIWSRGFVDGGRQIRGASGLGTFADAVVVSELAAVPVRTDLPAEQLSLLGCAVVTGAGSAINLASLEPGDSVLVIGAGGIGLSATQGARLKGACPLIVVDPVAGSRELATRCGATHTFEPKDVAAAVDELTAGIGVDTVFDCVGSSATLDQAWALSRRGGTIVEIGVPGAAVAVNVPLAQIPLSGKHLIGCVYGGTPVFRDIPAYVALAESGQFDLEVLLGDRITLADVPAALGGPLGAGRTVIVP
jgi:S-(hydroxymethyl)glutathione dehydrogenase / alcohol dehydrogenase